MLKLTLGVAGAVVLDGKCCEKVKGMENLDLDRLQGHWYPVMMDLTDPKAEGLTFDCSRWTVCRTSDFQYGQDFAENPENMFYVMFYQFHHG